MGKQGETKSSRRRKQGVRSSDGSVSVFLIIALAAVFMFVAIFIDYSRIAAMKVQSERLTRAAVRSVMSSYDPQLQKEYGLYAFGDSSGDLIMGNVLNDSLNPGDRSDAFRLMAMELDSSGLELQRPLGTYDIFNRQIIEDMKYKAPIDFTLELVNKFKPLSQSMKEASNTVDVLKQLRKLYDRREEALDEMLVKQRRAGEYAIKLSKLVMDPPGRSIYDASLGGSISTAADGASQYTDYKAKQQEDADRPPKEKLYTLQLMAYQNGISSIGSEISSEASRFQKENDKLLEYAYKLWEEARNLNEEMKQVIKDSENRSSNKGYDQVTNDVTPGSTDSSGSEAEMIQSIRKQADKLVHSDELMNSFRQEIEGQESLYQQVGHAVSSLQYSLGGEGMKGAVLEASHALQNYISNYGTSGGSNIIDRQQAALEQFRTSDKERKAMERQANRKLKQATKVIEVINGLNGQHQAMLDEFRELQQYYDESLQFNAEADSMSKGKPLHNDPYEAGKDAMDNMDGMFGFMGNVLGGVRDELFQNEYAVHYYQHFDIGNLSGIVDGSNASGDIAQEFAIGNQEVEYILYGFHNPAGNISAAYAEIFASRIAVRTMEGFIVNSKLGNPLAILAAAILYGIEKAIEDMIQLCQTGSIQLSKYVPVELTYRDHLRIFLFIHSDNERKLSRMLALIRLNTGINPAERSTYASGEVRTAMRLWFLPGVTKSLGVVFGSGGDEVQGNLYIVNRRADFSY
ncbi:hypothetical protein C7121_12585 [Paenibacillus glucanolyticus]|jgi:hypothetical protein|uniref:TadE/TadG family type IV pilus assembly protein n=1 Tax=Paenibacillus TaxID=44249 RepID=UPI0003E2A25D|nr:MULTISPECIES: hypothetical protein [Paenibacillus]ANA79187.1 hypothetical protein A3958_03830 [Paenibacillus glucanolyticus]AVV56884.1 hypothetical protein C7121_12585 [Paenibacillus glucanolyticus]ETT33998.1 hypothetical protein C169_20881 [Paenibacillus sp. FSL R5-808]